MMRLWNRNSVNGAQAPQASPGSSGKPPPMPPNSSKRRLKETNSIEDVKEIIKSPKTSAKSKKFDENQSEKKFPQLVQNQEQMSQKSHSDTNNNNFNL